MAEFTWKKGEGTPPASRRSGISKDEFQLQLEAMKLGEWIAVAKGSEPKKVKSRLETRVRRANLDIDQEIRLRKYSSVATDEFIIICEERPKKPNKRTKVFPKKAVKKPAPDPQPDPGAPPPPSRPEGFEEPARITITDNPMMGGS